MYDFACVLDDSKKGRWSLPAPSEVDGIVARQDAGLFPRCCLDGVGSKRLRERQVVIRDNTTGCLLACSRTLSTAGGTMFLLWAILPSGGTSQDDWDHMGLSAKAFVEDYGFLQYAFNCAPSHVKPFASSQKAFGVQGVEDVGLSGYIGFRVVRSSDMESCRWEKR